MESGRPSERRDAQLGRLAYSRGLLTISQLKTAINHQLQDLEKGREPARSLAEIFVEEGYLTQNELNDLIPLLDEASATVSPPTYSSLGKYTLLREIGRGGMGVVYDAKDTELDRRVAVKLLLAAPNQVHPEEERFLREAELASSLPGHPHIVRVHEAGTIDGKRYLAMELIDGITLTQWRRQGTLTMKQHVTLLRDIALAVHHAHEHGLIHRDLKPENILVDGENQPHITDFGLAKPVGTQAKASLTAEGMSIGTPAYMSPEQVQGRKDIDRRADIYSLGVILYKLLTGRLPFDGDTPFEIMRKTVQDEVVPPSRITKMVLNPVLYANLENMCLIALAKNPDDRYADAKALADDLTRWIEGDDGKTVVPRTLRAIRARRIYRRPAVVAAAAAALVSLALTGFLILRPAGLPPGTIPAASVESKPSSGAILEIYSGLNFNALGLRRVDSRQSFDNADGPAWPEGPPSFLSRRWRGYLPIEKTGDYVFRFRASEKAALSVSGISSENGKPRLHASLEAGLHEVILEQVQSGTDSLLTLDWKRKGEGAFSPLTPAHLRHLPGSFVARSAPDDNGSVIVSGAQEGEDLEILDASGHSTRRMVYGVLPQFWRGTWSGDAHLWWGVGVKPGDTLRLRFISPLEKKGALAVALTRASDHGIFRVSVNGTVVRDELDLHDPDLVTGEVEFTDVPLQKGFNEIEFTVTGTHPDARDWGEDSGLYKIGIDYVRIP